MRSWNRKQFHYCNLKLKINKKKTDSHDLEIFSFIPISGHYHYIRKPHPKTIELYLYSNVSILILSFVFAGIKCIETESLVLATPFAMCLMCCKQLEYKIHSLIIHSNKKKYIKMLPDQVHWRVIQQIESHCMLLIPPHITRAFDLIRLIPRSLLISVCGIVARLCLVSRFDAFTVLLSRLIFIRLSILRSFPHSGGLLESFATRNTWHREKNSSRE